MKKAVRIAIVFVSLLVLIAQAVAAPSDMLVSTEQLAAGLKDPKLVILHLGFDRTRYDKNHIPGARFILWKDVTVSRNGAANQPIINQLPSNDVLRAIFEKAGVSDDSRVVAYADAPLLATWTYYILDYFGHKNHAILNGDLEDWKAEKRPVDTAVPAVTAGKLTGAVHPELMLDMAAMQKIVAEKKLQIVDSRPPDHFTGKELFPDTPRGGHIPGAKNVWWFKSLASNTSPKLKSPAEIKAVYEAAGVKADQDVALYCRSGLMATHGYFTMKLAGLRPVAIYNGSFGEWSQAPGTPVEK